MLPVKRGKAEFPCPTEHAGSLTSQCEYLNSESRVRHGELTFVVVAAFLSMSLQCSIMQGADGLSPSPAKRSNTGFNIRHNHLCLKCCPLYGTYLQTL